MKIGKDKWGINQTEGIVFFEQLQPGHPYGISDRAFVFEKMPQTRLGEATCQRFEDGGLCPNDPCAARADEVGNQINCHFRVQGSSVATIDKNQWFGFYPFDVESIQIRSIYEIVARSISDLKVGNIVSGNPAMTVEIDQMRFRAL